MRRMSFDSGESLVEVMVSAVIFLMMMAVLEGSISFCTNAQHKSEQVRETNAEICRLLLMFLVQKIRPIYLRRRQQTAKHLDQKGRYFLV